MLPHLQRFLLTKTRTGKMNVSMANAFLERRPAWYMRYVANVQTTMAPAASIGLSYEHAMEFYMKNRHSHEKPEDPLEDPVRHASMDAGFTVFKDKTQDLDIEEANEAAVKLEAAIIAGWDVMDELLEKYGPVVDYQPWIEFEIPGLEGLVWLGRLDFRFEDAVIDLKTANKTPPSISAGQARQGAAYWLAEQKPIVFEGLVPLKTKTNRFTFTMDETNSPQYLNQLCVACYAMDDLLSGSARSIKAACVPNPDDWLIGKTEEAVAANEIWGIENHAFWELQRQKKLMEGKEDDQSEEPTGDHSEEPGTDDGAS